MTEIATSVPPVSRWRWNSADAALPTPGRFGEIVKTRSCLIASLCYLAVLLLMFWPLLKGDVLSSSAQTNLAPPFITTESIESVPYVSAWTGDFVEQFSYFEQYQYRAAREGRFPTWNPHIYLGQPFHADGQSAMLFPTHWIYFVVNPDLARGPMTILRLWLSAMALFCLLRRFSISPTAAFAGGSIWIFGSFNMHWLLWPHTNSSLWFPIIILALEFLITKPTWRGFAVASLAIAPLFLAGHPGTEYLCFEVISLYCLMRLIGLIFHGITIRQLIIRVVAVGSASVMGMVAAAAALLPLFMQIRASFEYIDPSSHRGMIEKLPWNSLWLFLMPEYYGRPRGAFPGFAYTGAGNYIETTLWFGAIACILALAFFPAILLPRFGPSAQKWRSRFTFLPVFGLTAFLLALLIAFCVWPVYNIASSLPGAAETSLRRLFLGAHFAGAILAACAIHQILSLKDRTVAMISSLFAITGCVLVTHSLWARWDEIELNWMKSIANLPTQMGAGWPRVVYPMIEEFAGFRMMIGAILLLIGTALLFCILVLTLRRQETSPTLRYLFAAVITLDVLLPGYNFNPVTPAKLIVPPTPEVLQSMILQAGDGRMAANDMNLDPNISMQFNFRDIRGYELPHSPRLAKLYKKLGIDELDYRGLIKIPDLYPYINSKIEAYLDRICMRSIMLYIPDPNAVNALPALKLLKEFETPGYMNWPRTAAPGNGVLVFSNPNSYPRTYFAKTADLVSTPDDAMDAFLDSSNDLRDHSVYEGASSPHPAQAVLTSDDFANITQDKPEQVTITSQAASDHLLVLADRMDNGWQVTIDAKPADAVTANYLFRGVFVPAGHHTVEWTYHAPGLIAGFAISAVTVLGMIGMLIGTSIRRTV
jgi:hypothetical protein